MTLKSCMVALVGLLVSLMAIDVNAGFFGPSNYDECVLENMKGVTSDQAARAITNACRQKYSEKPKAQSKSRDLTNAELSQLTGRGREGGEYFSGTMYNGNKDLTLSQVSIEIMSKTKGKDTPRVYVTDVKIPPLSSGTFIFAIVTGDAYSKYEWSIVGAKGF